MPPCISRKLSALQTCSADTIPDTSAMYLRTLRDIQVCGPFLEEPENRWGNYHTRAIFSELRAIRMFRHFGGREIFLLTYAPRMGGAYVSGAYINLSLLLFLKNYSMLNPSTCIINRTSCQTFQLFTLKFLITPHKSCTSNILAFATFNKCLWIRLNSIC